MCWHWPGELRAATVPTRDRGGDGLQPLEHAEPGSAGQGRGPIHSCNLQAALANSCGFPPILSAWGKAQGRLTGQRRAIGGDSRVLWKCFRDVSFGGGGGAQAALTPCRPPRNAASCAVLHKGRPSPQCITCGEFTSRGPAALPSPAFISAAVLAAGRGCAPPWLPCAAWSKGADAKQGGK